MKNLTRISLFSLLTLMIACQKNEPPPSPDPVPTPSAPLNLVRSIIWQDGITTSFEYQPDSSLISRRDQSGTSNQLTSYVWQNGRMIEQFIENSLYTNEYEYNNTNQLIRILHKYKSIPIPVSRELEFQYLPSGHLSVLRYSDQNEAGKTLIYRSQYHYDANQDLQRIDSYDKDGIKRITYLIETNSDSCQINPWIYINAGIQPYYELYNYPVLSKMSKLPSRIRITDQDATGTITSTRFIENHLTIDSTRIEQLETKLIYPASPQNNGSRMGDYRYN